MERKKNSARSATNRTHHENHARHRHDAQLEGQRGAHAPFEKSHKGRQGFKEQ